MDVLSIVNFGGAVCTIIAAVLVASNISPKVMIVGFSVFIVASVLWMTSGYLDHKSSLLIQNAVLMVVNIAGIIRWYPKA
jgi:hypothetical protein